EDVLATAAALNALGASVTRGGDGRWTVDGIGVGALAEPENLLDLGNSGTAARLLLGMLATPDNGLRNRRCVAEVPGDGPARRAAGPLRGAFRQPRRRSAALAVSGAVDPIPIVYRLPV